MPITSINAQAGVLEQICAVCRATREIKLAELQLGSDLVHVSPDRIDLPACACGAVEQLFRTWDTHPSHDKDSDHNRHRMVVNGLATHLKRIGRSHPACADHHAAESRTPPDHLELPDGPWRTFDRKVSP